MRWPKHVAVGKTRDVLWRIFEPTINLAVWLRPNGINISHHVDRQLCMELFKKLAQTEWILHRVEHVSGNMAEAWHQDEPAIRMLVNYREPCTQWLDNRTFRFLRMVLPFAGSVSEELVRTLPVFAVSVHKGRSYPDKSVIPWVHRSPTPPAGVKLVNRELLVVNGQTY